MLAGNDLSVAAHYMRALADDLDRLAAGGASGEAELAAAPVLHAWRPALSENGEPAVTGIVRDRDSVQLVLTEPGQKSALRRAIDGSRALPPVVFQTSDAFFSLARSAKEELTVLSPFLDRQGAEFLVELFALCSEGVRRSLICRPLDEPDQAFAYPKMTVTARPLPYGGRNGRPCELVGRHAPRWTAVTGERE